MAALAQVSTATACHMLGQKGWRNTHAAGVLTIAPLGLGVRFVGRARTLRYLPRRSPEVVPGDEATREALRLARRDSPEIALIEALEPGDVLCVEALGCPTSGIIGDILSARIRFRGAVAAVIDGVVRDTPFIRQVGLPVFARGSHPSASGRDLVPVAGDVPIHVSGVNVQPGDVVLLDDEGAVFMPADLAAYVAGIGPGKEHMELWIRDKIAAGASVLDYYPPGPAQREEYRRETGRDPVPF